MSYVTNCQDLVAYIDTGFAEQHFVLVETNPSKIMQDTTGIIAIWAQSLTGSYQMVNMRLPGIKNFLRLLAMNGPGYSGEYNNVRYKFVLRKSSQRKSVPRLLTKYILQRVMVVGLLPPSPACEEARVIEQYMQFQGDFRSFRQT